MVCNAHGLGSSARFSDPRHAHKCRLRGSGSRMPISSTLLHMSRSIYDCRRQLCRNRLCDHTSTVSIVGEHNSPILSLAYHRQDIRKLVDEIQATRGSASYRHNLEQSDKKTWKKSGGLNDLWVQMMLVRF